MSLPVWECGLKLAMIQATYPNFNPSLPVWECGLKLVSTAFSAGYDCHSPCGSVD